MSLSGNLAENNAPELEQEFMEYLEQTTFKTHRISALLVEELAKSWLTEVCFIFSTSSNKETGPDNMWWIKFKKRHSKELTFRKPDNLDRGRSRMANENVMRQHVTLLGETLDKLGIKNQPERINIQL